MALVYILFPKNIGFIETVTLPNGQREILGQHYRCFGLKLSQRVNNRTMFRCIGIPHSRITI